MRRSLFFLCATMAVLGVLVSCGKAKLDSQNLQASIAKVRKSVDQSRRPDFDLAMDTVKSASQGKIEGTKSFSLDGMTAEAVFAEAKKIDLRRDLVWAERSIANERQVVDAKKFLSHLQVHDLHADRGDDGEVHATFEIENGLGTAIDTAWLRIDVPRGDGRGTLGGEDMVELRPPLKPGERRKVRILVSSDASRALPPEAGTQIASRFTLVELGGNLLLQEPKPEELAEAQKRLAAAEKERDAIKAKLGS